MTQCVLKSHWMYLYCFLFGTSLINLFVPMILHITSEIETDSHPILSHSMYECASQIAIALCAPMSVEIVLDFCFLPSAVKTPDFFIKVYVVLVFLIPNIAIYSTLVCGAPSFALFDALVTSQVVAFGYPLMLLLNYFYSRIYSTGWVFLIVGASWLNRCFLLLHSLFGWAVFDYLSIAARVVLILAGPPLLMYWFYSNFNVVRSVMFGQSDLESLPVPRPVAMMVIYVFVFTVLAVSHRVASFLGLHSVEGGLLYLFAQILMIALLGIFPRRLALFDLACSDDNLERRKAVVQYISHESRGPLQVASMGLELHLQDMLALDKKILCGAAGGADEVRSALTEQMRSVAEVADACSLAQQTLGDLLTFDRIQLGALVMEKAVVSVFPFVSAVCGAFAIQARYKRIELAFDWTVSLDARYEHMTVLADRTKLTQALRNLLSNALKFTPIGGKIRCVVRVLRKVGVDASSADHSGPANSRTASDRSSTTGSRNPGSRRTSDSLSVSFGLPLSSKSPVSHERSVSISSRLAVSSSCANSKPFKGATSYSGHPGMTRAVLEDVSLPENGSGANTLEDQADSLICRVEIEDGGPGISVGNMAKLFGKFVQFNPAGLQQGGGSGLGLWLTRAIMERHSGAIGAASEGVGCGCIFFVDIPVHSLSAFATQKPSCDAVESGDMASASHSRNSLHPLLSERSVDSAMLPGSHISGGSLSGSGTQGSGALAGELYPAPHAAAGSGTGQWSNWEQQQQQHNEALAQTMVMGKMADVLRDSRSQASSSRSSGSSSRQGSKKSHALISVASGSAVASAANSARSGGSTSCGDSMSKPGDVAMSARFSGLNTFTSAKDEQQKPLIHVMIVDDMGSNRKVLRRALQSIDSSIGCVEHVDGTDAVAAVAASLSVHQIRCASDADKGTAIDNNVADSSFIISPEIPFYDIIFIDCQMVNLDGPAAVEQMRKEHGYTGLIYGVSGDARSLDTFRQMGATDAFEKPMKRANLEMIINAYKASVKG